MFVPPPTRRLGREAAAWILAALMALTVLLLARGGSSPETPPALQDGASATSPADPTPAPNPHGGPVAP